VRASGPPTSTVSFGPAFWGVGARRQWIRRLTNPFVPFRLGQNHYGTVGGINEQCYVGFRERGGAAASDPAMNAMEKRHEVL
jgi:hypothetical protein